jgi:hypothetical protein
MVFFNFNQLTQLIHALSFVRFHADWDDTTQGAFVRRKGYSSAQGALSENSPRNQGHSDGAILTNSRAYGVAEGL